MTDVLGAYDVPLREGQLVAYNRSGELARGTITGIVRGMRRPYYASEPEHQRRTYRIHIESESGDTYFVSIVRNPRSVMVLKEPSSGRERKEADRSSEGHDTDDDESWAQDPCDQIRP